MDDVQQVTDIIHESFWYKYIRDVSQKTKLHVFCPLYNNISYSV